MRLSAVLFAIVALAETILGQAAKRKGLEIKELPTTVQQAVQANLRGAEIRNISKEKENGVEQFEIESILRGRRRDFNVDSKGVLLVTEEETTLELLPASAKAGILKIVGAGKLDTVETFSKPGRPLMYEASYTDKSGKKREVLVNGDGAETKD